MTRRGRSGTRVLRAVVVTLGVGILLGCGADRREAVGVTPMGPDRAPTTSASGSTSAPTWTHFATVRGWPKANAKRFLSAGHLFGRYEADLHVNSIAQPAYAALAPGSTLPVGAVVAKVHATPGGDGAAPIFAMEKTTDGWTYLETDAAGHVLRRGRLHPCVDCHAQVASQDELFGVPTTGR